MMDGQAVDNIADLAREASELEEVLGTRRRYSRRTGELIDPVRYPAMQEVWSLEQLVRFAETVHIGAEERLFCVVTPTAVHLVGDLDEENQRAAYAKCSTNRIGIAEGQYDLVEDFIIGLMYRATATADRDKVVELVGNLTTEEVRKETDDGFSQKVAKHSSVTAGLETVRVENPFSLAPFRTFAEIEQPDSPYILRIGKRGDDSMVAALFLADGGGWQDIACRRIRMYLTDNMPEAVIVL